jgi:hypothetical protein
METLTMIIWIIIKICRFFWINKIVRWILKWLIFFHQLGTEGPLQF